MSFIKNQVKLSIGTMIEWYDAMLYIAFIPYLMQSFLPNVTQTKALLILFLGFAAGNAIRPIGSVIFGIIGDRFSKQYSYNLSITLMCISTIIMGLIPCYQSLGIAAPILLIITRFLQGLSMGGQFGTLLSINSDYHRSGKKIGFINTLCQSISYLGHTLAIITVLIITTIKTDFSHNLWRYPFILVIIFLVYHLLWGQKVSFNETKNENTSKYLFNEFLTLCKHYKLHLICNTLLSFCISSIFTIVAFYSLQFMKFNLHINYGQASIYNLIFFWIIILLSPVFGKIFDHSNKRLVYFFIIATAIITILFWPILEDNRLNFIYYFMILSALLSAIRGAVLIELSVGLPKNCNCFGINITYTIGITLASFIPVLLVKLTEKSILFIPFIVLILCIILLITFIILNIINIENKNS